MSNVVLWLVVGSEQVTSKELADYDYQSMLSHLPFARYCDVVHSRVQLGLQGVVQTPSNVVLYMCIFSDSSEGREPKVHVCMLCLPFVLMS